MGDSAYGLQFHPDVTYAMMCKWTVEAHERMNLPGAQRRHKHLEGWFQHDAAVARWTSAFLRRWLGPIDCDGLAPAETILGTFERAGGLQPERRRSRSFDVKDQFDDRHDLRP